ncbi:MAG: hypothetical protein H7333_05910 [Bdellovibrionales bacterium]|nr:hypothetical protein [Oligoflexia bacterium]
MKQSTKSHLGLLCLSLVFLNACGQADAIIDAVTAKPSLTQLVDQSVNQASTAMSGAVFQLQTQTGANPVGAFVGGGAGNKAISSLPGYHKFPLSQLSTITFEAKRTTGSTLLYLNLIVDLDCTLDEDLSNTTAATIANIRANRKILSVDQFTVVALDDSYSSYTVNAIDSIWLAVGTAGGLPANNPGGTLITFLATYPNACIINGVADDGGMGREVGVGCQTGAGLATSAPAYCGKLVNGIVFAVGSSSTATQETWLIRKIKVNSTEYQ